MLSHSQYSNCLKVGDRDSLLPNACGSASRSKTDLGGTGLPVETGSNPDVLTPRPLCNLSSVPTAAESGLLLRGRASLSPDRAMATLPGAIASAASLRVGLLDLRSMSINLTCPGRIYRAPLDWKPIVCPAEANELNSRGQSHQTRYRVDSVVQVILFWEGVKKGEAAAISQLLGTCLQFMRFISSTSPEG